MDFIKMFKDINKEFDSETSLLACIAHSINLNMEVCNSDLVEIGAYTKRLNAKTKEILWEHTDKVDLAIEIRDAFIEFNNRESFHGMGGCERKTLKEIMLKD